MTNEWIRLRKSFAHHRHWRDSEIEDQRKSHTKSTKGQKRCTHSRHTWNKLTLGIERSFLGGTREQEKDSFLHRENVYVHSSIRVVLLIRFRFIALLLCVLWIIVRYIVMENEDSCSWWRWRRCRAHDCELVEMTMKIMFVMKTKTKLFESWVSPFSFFVLISSLLLVFCCLDFFSAVFVNCVVVVSCGGVDEWGFVFEWILEDSVRGWLKSEIEWGYWREP